MRILQLVQKPQRRGAEIFASQLSHALSSRGHDMRTAYLYPAPPDRRLDLAKGDVNLNGTEDHLLERFLGAHPILLRRVRRVISNFRPHIVQVNGGRAVKYGALARGNGTQWVLVYRNIGTPADWIPDWRRKLFYRFLMSRVDGVVSLSSVGLKALESFYRFDVPAVAIHNGFDPGVLVPKHSRAETRAVHGLGENARLLLYVGSLSREKRVDRLLDVHRQVVTACAEAVLWIAGDGPLRQELEERTRWLGIQESVRFLGVQDDTAALYNAADAVVLTSDTEGVPAVLLEAGHLRVPVVASNVGGISECVLDGVTGFLVQRHCVADYTDRVLQLLRSDSLRQRMGEQGHRHINEHFGIVNVAEQYLQFYTELLQERPSGLTGASR